MRKLLWLGCVLALVATGCSLDLDRLRGTPDAGDEMDSGIADASMPIDAPMQREDAGLDASTDASTDDAGSDGGVRCTATCAASATFGAPRDVSLASAPVDVELGDITGDGFLDVVVLTMDGSVLVLSAEPDGAGCGSRALRATDTVASTSGAADLALGDADDDGRLDAAVVGTGGALALHTTDAAGKLGAAQTLDFEGNAFGVTFSGRRIHVAGGGTSGAVRAFELAGGALVELESASAPPLVEIASMTLADGTPGLASSSLIGAAVLVDRVQEAGAPTRVATVPVSAGSHIASGDLDGDGDDDLAMNAIGTSRVTMILADGDTFTLAPRADASGVVDALAIGALDDDEQVDVAVIVGTAVYPYVLGDPRVPGGALIGRPGVALDGEGRDVVIGDLDGDALPDLVVIGEASGGHEVRVVPGACP
ncbi:FG-GAP-like repeat-containing protein [Sandaracinus amylolyticus]|uniref:FG-GAP repeat protein n=1 Tax=Sandaracinus amylolyticus TaxID=927083 RepID=A0A0F6YJZ2_9BACT|nr:FG-GAP-like repeat-containing protein [Sandaracinus amylolyticus]AKF07716.1 hypothetical protein DB32_004865 [Sandaracinus amylolyticus]